ncbi:MAG: DUF4340 domain-containing protein [Oscillospiraceae bacterium]
MKRSKRLYALLGILVVACLATFAVTRMEEEKEQIKAAGEIILEVSGDDVQSLSWEYGDTSLAFHKDEKWLYDSDEAFPVDEEIIRRMLEQFESFGVSFVIENVTDYSMYGLDDPECTICFATEEQSYQIELGDFSNMDEERYVSIGDGNVYLAKVDPLDQFDVVLRDMIRHDENLSYDQVTRITFEGAENYTIFYEEDSPDTYCADDVYFTEQNGENVPLDTDRVGKYLEGPVTAQLKNYVTYNATEEELASFGLDHPELVITVDYTVQNAEGEEVSDTYTLSISRDPEELAALKENAEDDAEDDEAEDDEETLTAYARVGESQIVYQLDESKYTALMAASYNDLRHRNVLTADFGDVYQVDISLEDSSYTLFLDREAEDDEPIWKYREEEIIIDTFEKELYSLSASSSDDFVSEEPGGKQEISLTLYLENETYPEITIELYRYDGEDCLAVLDGQTFALIKRADAVDLIEAVNAIVLS